jgi:coenzyme F420 biosynthesis associated uncharacterized protein
VAVYGRIVRGVAVGLASGLAAAVVAEVVRPRGGNTRLLDWQRVESLARRRVGGERLTDRERAEVATSYNRLAAEVRQPLLEAVGGLPPGARLPDFEALDRATWLELNIGIMRRVLSPLEEVSLVPSSLLADAGRAALDRYVALVLAFLAGRVLGQFDPQLLGREPVRHALYLVEPNVAGWEAQERLPAEDLRRWLILHEMTHAWQFAAHPWLQDHLNGQLERLIELASEAGHAGLDRMLAMTLGVPRQLEVVRRMQATMSLVEGYGNLVMNQVGRRILPSFELLEAAYRRRSAQRSVLEVLIWRLTGLELKLQQYRVGEAFALAMYQKHGMAALNRAWESPESLPRPDELRNPERWYLRVIGESDGRDPALATS